MADTSGMDLATMMAMNQLNQPNPYLSFTGKLPLPGYVGWPNDAQGQPIQKPQGMTLNSSPAAAPAAAAAPQQGGSWAENQLQGWAAMDPVSGNLASIMPGSDAAMAQAAIPLGQRMYNAQHGNFAANMAPQQPAAPAAAPAPTDNASGLSPSQYLSLLANPGKVTTPGATGPQSNFNASNGVLQQFLQNWKPGNAQGANFASALKGWSGGRGGAPLGDMRNMQGGGSSTSGN